MALVYFVTKKNTKRKKQALDGADFIKILAYSLG